ncbi:hypothetical protein PVAG01_08532 [Phlyctema vagabunda]|uniref:RNA helicase n=1 Tax=Phlyctema vagabunda TaxID=108571 RepID=A0ABR4P9N6_9HELO
MPSINPVNGRCALCMTIASKLTARTLIRRHPRAFTTSASKCRKKVSPSEPIIPRGTLRSGPKTPFAYQRRVINDDGSLDVQKNKIVEYQNLAQLMYDEFHFMIQTWSLSIGGDVRQLGKSLEDHLKHNLEVSKSDENAIDILNRDKLFASLRKALTAFERRGLQDELRYRLLNDAVGIQFSEGNHKTHQKLADLHNPIEWYPATRAIQREVHLHVGPTNSGKTYHALKRLESANTGVYAGPLRLLAHEVYTRLNAAGKGCALITGEERRTPVDSTKKALLSSCTVEMVPLNTQVDVAVIDEIQMLGDECRGWAWTQALLGLQAKELHLCGELRTVPLIEDLCTLMGDKLIIHRYQRLSPLATASESIDGRLENLQKGDCVIVFSRVGIHAMKNSIEKATGKRCAVVYGSLPPETRAQQAALFNDPDNDYDFLAASDAIGMGLNLSIKRVIFESVSKMGNSGTRNPLAISDIKQIGGRAGRFKTAAQAVSDGIAGNKEDTSALAVKEDPTGGIVTTLESWGLKYVRKCMKADAPPLTTAGIIPPDHILESFAAYFPKKTPFSYILARLMQISRTSSQFHLCQLKDQVEVADLIQPYDLSIRDRVRFLSGPANPRDLAMHPVIQGFAKAIADQSGGELLNIQGLDLELLGKTKEDFVVGTKAFLQQLERLHKALTLYLWLSYRFESVFTSQALCFHAKSMTEERIDECLKEVASKELYAGIVRKVGGPSDGEKEPSTSVISKVERPSSGEKEPSTSVISKVERPSGGENESSTSATRKVGRPSGGEKEPYTSIVRKVEGSIKRENEPRRARRVLSDVAPSGAKREPTSV